MEGYCNGAEVANVEQVSLINFTNKINTSRSRVTASIPDINPVLYRAQLEHHSSSTTDPKIQGTINAGTRENGRHYVSRE